MGMSRLPEISAKGFSLRQLDGDATIYTDSSIRQEIFSVPPSGAQHGSEHYRSWQLPLFLWFDAASPGINKKGHNGFQLPGSSGGSFRCSELRCKIDAASGWRLILWRTVSYYDNLSMVLQDI